MLKHILLVDDDEDDREFFCLAVKEVAPALSITCCSNGDDALRVLHYKDSVLPDLIFLDNNMPRVSGKELLLKIKQNQQLSSIPVIVYSTSSHENEIKELKTLGASLYMVKPYRFKELMRLLNDLLHRNWKKA